MADLTQRFSNNVAGRYYVDHTCVRCELCHEMAPDHFTQTQENDGYVCRQPINAAEEKACKVALENCPVGAIGDDAS